MRAGILWESCDGYERSPLMIALALQSVLCTKCWVQVNLFTAVHLDGNRIFWFEISARLKIQFIKK